MVDRLLSTLGSFVVTSLWFLLADYNFLLYFSLPPWRERLNMLFYAAEIFLTFRELCAPETQVPRNTSTRQL
jgi:hypothetical protein